MMGVDPRRFGPYIDRDYEISRAKEDYVLRHEIPYPGLNRTDGRPVKTSPLYERIKERGAVYEEIFGWERPQYFSPDGSPEDQPLGIFAAVENAKQIFEGAWADRAFWSSARIAWQRATAVSRTFSS